MTLLLTKPWVDDSTPLSATVRLVDPDRNVVLDEGTLELLPQQTRGDVRWLWRANDETMYDPRYQFEVDGVRVEAPLAGKRERAVLTVAATKRIGEYTHCLTTTGMNSCGAPICGWTAHDGEFTEFAVAADVQPSPGDMVWVEMGFESLGEFVPSEYAAVNATFTSASLRVPGRDPRDRLCARVHFLGPQDGEVTEWQCLDTETTIDPRRGCSHTEPSSFAALLIAALAFRRQRTGSLR
jgi:hypothetical protein